MARLAVDKWQPCSRLYLLSMDTMLEVIGDLFVHVTLGYTIVSANIICVESAND